MSGNRCLSVVELCFAEREFWIPGARLVYVVKSLTNTLGQKPMDAFRHGMRARGGVYFIRIYIKELALTLDKKWAVSWECVDV